MTFTKSIGLLAVITLLAGCGQSGTQTETQPQPKPAKQGGDKPTFYFSAIPDQNSTELKEKFDKVAAYLAKELEVPVVYKPSKDYGASVEEFRNGNVMLAWFGGLTGVQAMHLVPGARAIAQGKADPQFYSYFIAHKDSGLTESEEFPAGIAKVPFCFGSEKSTSGRLMPQYFIEQASGKSMDEFFGDNKPAFSGSHDNTYEWVKAGKVKAGVLNYKVYGKNAAKDDSGNVKIIWKTPFYADYNLTAHPDLDKTYGAGFIDKLQAALVGMKDPELLGAFQREALIPAKNEDFDGIKKVAEKLGFLN